jgi:hypothetical protein
MDKQLALKLIAFLSFGGILFSGYLSYNELFAGGCGNTAISCGSNTFNIADIPACVYGFIMYALIFLISVTGYAGRATKP